MLNEGGPRLCGGGGWILNNLLIQVSYNYSGWRGRNEQDAPHLALLSNVSLALLTLGFFYLVTSVFFK